ncbi:MAG: hypothetical protein AMJ53_14440 [Gammaproteobacteria bacterium SG8_11]|nr:MAG: hypothetical protein AMJ53_14440 [Gammaproteobacteria bacterium SG8_11]
MTFSKLLKSRVQAIIITSLALGLLVAPTLVFSDNECAIPKSMTTTPPKSGETPVKVSLGIYIIDIIELDEIKESFKLDYTIDAFWLDPRLSAEARGYSLDDCRLNLDGIWNPNIRVLNVRDPSKIFFEKLNIDDSGGVNYYLRLQTNFSSSFDLHEFPFDQQKLTMRFASFDYGPKDVVFEINKTLTGRLDGIESAGWSIVSNASDPDSPVVSAGGEEFSQLNHYLTIKRKAGYYIWKFVVPLCFIVLMASSVFWLDPESFGPQIGISTAAVFTLVAFLLGLRQGLPQVAYLTRMDEMVLAATILVFTSFGEVIYVSRLVNKQRSDLARRIDVHARWIYLSAFALLIYFILIKPGIA